MCNGSCNDSPTREDFNRLVEAIEAMTERISAAIELVANVTLAMLDDSEEEHPQKKYLDGEPI